MYFRAGSSNQSCACASFSLGLGKYLSCVRPYALSWNLESASVLETVWVWDAVVKWIFRSFDGSLPGFGLRLALWVSWVLLLAS